MRLADFLDVFQRLHLLDQHFDADRPLRSELLLDLIEQRGGEIHVLPGQHLRYHDGVEIFARALDHGDDVLIGVFGGKIVDTHAAGLLAPGKRAQRLDDLSARLDLGRGRDRVFKIEKDVIGGARGRLRHHLFARAWHRELHPPEPPRSFHGFLPIQPGVMPRECGAPSILRKQATCDSTSRMRGGYWVARIGGR
jgi:hypothetical protein